MIAGLILAAGAGTRFGSEPKLLADLDGSPLLEHAVRAQCAVAALERVVVVLGSHADEIAERVDLGRAEPVVCEEWSRGQAASLGCGVRALAGASKVIVTLGDEPLIPSALIERFVAEPPGTRAVYRGRPGHPVVLGPDQLRAIGALSGDRGASELLDGGPRIECADGGDVGKDVDTPDDLERIRDESSPVL